MREELIRWVLGILTTLLAGTNVVTLLNNRQLRRKMSAEGYQLEIDAQQKIIDGCTKEIDRLQSRLDDSDKRYDDLREKYNELERKYDEREKIFYQKYEELKQLIMKH